jgi:hypothetical protein
MIFDATLTFSHVATHGLTQGLCLHICSFAPPDEDIFSFPTLAFLIAPHRTPIGVYCPPPRRFYAPLPTIQDSLESSKRRSPAFRLLVEFLQMFATFSASLIIAVWNVIASLPDYMLTFSMLPFLFPIYYLVWVIYATQFHPLAKYPGPIFAAITRFWLILNVARGSSEKTQRCLHEQYGKSIWSNRSTLARADKYRACCSNRPQ